MSLLVSQLLLPFMVKWILKVIEFFLLVTFKLRKDVHGGPI